MSLNVLLLSYLRFPRGTLGSRWLTIRPSVSFRRRTDAFLCYCCFARDYKKDDCPTCSRPVLGVKHDPFVSAAGRDYHARCFVCVRAYYFSPPLGPLPPLLHAYSS